MVDREGYNPFLPTAARELLGGGITFGMRCRFYIALGGAQGVDNIVLGLDHWLRHQWGVAWPREAMEFLVEVGFHLARTETVEQNIAKGGPMAELP